MKIPLAVIQPCYVGVAVSSYAARLEHDNTFWTDNKYVCSFMRSSLCFYDSSFSLHTEDEDGSYRWPLLAFRYSLFRLEGCAVAQAHPQCALRSFSLLWNVPSHFLQPPFYIIWSAWKGEIVFQTSFYAFVENLLFTAEQNQNSPKRNKIKSVYVPRLCSPLLVPWGSFLCGWFFLNLLGFVTFNSQLILRSPTLRFSFVINKRLMKTTFFSSCRKASTAKVGGMSPGLVATASPCRLGWCWLKRSRGYSIALQVRMVLVEEVSWLQHRLAG